MQISDLKKAKTKGYLSEGVLQLEVRICIRMCIYTYIYIYIYEYLDVSLLRLRQRRVCLTGFQEERWFQCCCYLAGLEHSYGIDAGFHKNDMDEFGWMCYKRNQTHMFMKFPLDRSAIIRFPCPLHQIPLLLSAPLR